MLTVKMGGKAVSTTNNKQVMNINGNDVEIERIGNAIYVNGISINVILAEKVGVKWKDKIILLVAVGAVGFSIYVFATNSTYAIAEIKEVSQWFITQGSALFAWVMGYVS